MFKNRTDAGEQLCPLIKMYKGKEPLLYALPRGGVVVAEPIARFLQVPIHLLITRKIGHPLQPQWAIAAISESGFMASDPHLKEYVDAKWLERAKAQEMQEIQRRKQAYQQKEHKGDLRDKTVLIVDDGIATGLTLEAGILEMKSHHPKQIVVVVPVAPQDVAMRFKGLVDAFIAFETPLDYKGAVGAYYASFSQVTDEEVRAILSLK